MRKRVSKRMKLLGAFIICMLIGVAAAAISNTLTGQWGLINETPVVLSWKDGIDPFSDTVICGVEQTAVLVVENFGDSAIAFYLAFVIEGPVGISTSYLTLIVGGESLTWNLAEQTATAALMGLTIGVGVVQEYTVSMTFNVGLPMGTYSCVIYGN